MGGYGTLKNNYPQHTLLLIRVGFDKMQEPRILGKNGTLIKYMATWKSANACLPTKPVELKGLFHWTTDEKQRDKNKSESK